MIKYIRGENLFQHAPLAKQMFKDRAYQFGERLGWDVKIDSMGLERDQYDCLNPIYVVEHDDQGKHLGSMRILPTTGRTMLNDYFRDFYAGATVSRPDIWECTRFCVTSDADRRTTTRLLAAGARLMKELSITQLVATFNEPMLRFYRVTGTSPAVIGSRLTPQGEISVGLWRYSLATYQRLLRLGALDPVEMELFVANSDISGEIHYKPQVTC